MGNWIEKMNTEIDLRMPIAKAKAWFRSNWFAVFALVLILGVAGYVISREQNIVEKTFKECGEHWRTVMQENDLRKEKYSCLCFEPTMINWSSNTTGFFNHS